MTAATKPAKRPGNVLFSSGPCAKRPGWSLQALDKAFLGRSHRAKAGKARLKLAIDKTKALLGLPPGYVCGIVPASDTGAFEMAMWTMLGRAASTRAGPGELRQRLGDGHYQAAEAEGPARARGRVRGYPT
jgi:phosphoserine aminotransferase